MGISFKQVEHNYPGLKKHDVVAAIKNVDLEIEATDEFVAIVGQTGSGKSTLVQHMNCLLLPTNGVINIFESTITSKKRKNPPLKPIRKRIGFVFQFPEYQLFEETVIKDILFGPNNFGFSKEEALESAKKACEILKIDDSLLEKSPFNLSGGQMRKVAIAGVLAYNPDILLLDEPTRGLDPLTAIEVMKMFNKIHTELHKTIIIITHDMNIVHEYAKRVVVMKDGMVYYDGNPVTLFKDGIYEDCHLNKPDILKVIDFINNKLNINLDYNIKTHDDLIKSLKEVYSE